MQDRVKRALGVSLASALLCFAAVSAANPNGTDNRGTPPPAAPAGTASSAETSTIEASLVELADSAAISLAPGQADTPTQTYIVQMALDPVIAYDGGIRGLPATRPARGQKLDPLNPAVARYKDHLVRQQNTALRAVGAPGQAKKYSFGYAFNGFAATLTEAQVRALKKRGDVVQVWADELQELNTNFTPDFLGLNDPSGGLVADLGLTGEDVVIGIIDTGYWPEHPSFSDRTGTNPRGRPGKLSYRQLPGWNARCVPGENFNASHCNQKMIAAHFYNAGFLSFADIVPEDFLSPRDSSGHGSHVAATAAGNADVQPTFDGVAAGSPVSGIAPRARIASYKTCWVQPGGTTFSCATSDLQAAIDQAVADGVDVINYSIGSSAPRLIGPTEIAFLFAADAGIFVATSAGNSGPGPATVGSPAGVPWVTTVGASTRDGTRTVPAIAVTAPEAVAGNYPAVEGAIGRSLKEAGTISAPLVVAEPLLACGPLSNNLHGAVALIARGGCPFTDKVENAVDAGAVAVIVYTIPTQPKGVMGGDPTPKTRSVPSVMIDNAPGVALASAIGTGAGQVRLGPGLLTEEPTVGNIMAGFSSRGGNRSAPDIIKPDVTAPGVAILAATTPSPSLGGAPGELFAYLQGTSMSSPHVAGIAALIKEARPAWSPAAIRSAMVTTARQNLTKEDGVSPADPFDFGGGHIVPNALLEPGLVYDAGLLDYFGFLCDAAPETFADPAATCASLEALGIPTDAASLNYPSIGVAELVGERTVTRSVTSVASATSTYSVSVAAPAGIDVAVEPSTFTISPGETVSFSVTFSVKADVQPNVWAFGSLTWSDGIHTVRSPIAVRPRGLVFPAELTLAGTAGNAEVPVQFGFNGTYTAGVHGPAAPLLIPGTVENDPTNQFVFFGPGTTFYTLNLPPGLAYFRAGLFNEFTSGDDDLDLYLYYCPGGSCSLRATSTNVDSNESASVLFPQAGLWAVFVHGFETDGPVASFTAFNWAFSATPGSGILAINGNNVTTTIETELGQAETLDLSWSGLPAGNRFLGGISHSSPGGLEGLTIIGIYTD